MKLGIRSLTIRLLLLALILSCSVLIIAGFFLTSIFRSHAEMSFDQQLITISKGLDAPLADRLSKSDNEYIFPFGDNQFYKPVSGWYWMIINEKEEILFESPSLLGLEVDFAIVETIAGSAEAYSTTDSADNDIRVIYRRIQIADQFYHIFVTGNSNSLDKATISFNQMVVTTLVTLAIGMILTIVLMIRFGLKPLAHIRESLTKIRSGSADRLIDPFATEIQPLADEVNALIFHNEQLVKRAQTHAGNLAHALKTPLSVMRNDTISLTDKALKTRFEQQINQMQSQVDHHLQQARMAAQRRAINPHISLAPLAEKLIAALKKIYHIKALNFHCNISSRASSRLSPQDFDELLGNLLDNACKWAKKNVYVSINTTPHSDFEEIYITVEDDGPGLSMEQRKEALKRGKRLDETVPGTGLGLSIVEDLCNLYQIELVLQKSDKGGLCVCLTFPV